MLRVFNKSKEELIYAGKRRISDRNLKERTGALEKELNQMNDDFDKAKQDMKKGINNEKVIFSDTIGFSEDLSNSN